MRIIVFTRLPDIRKWSIDSLTITAVILLAISSFQLSGCARTPEKQGADQAAKVKSIEDAWGIQIIGVRQTAAGYMLDFRYRVIDPEKASPLFVRKTKPYLVDQASGARFAVPSPPKTGPLRTSDPPQANRNYFIFFANPGKFVKAGNTVTVVIGNFKAENLTVE